MRKACDQDHQVGDYIRIQLGVDFLGVLRVLGGSTVRFMLKRFCSHAKEMR